MRSAVPLPCFFDVVKSQRVAGQRPRQGTKSCRMGRNSVSLYIRPPIRFPYKGSESSWRGQRASWRGLRASWRCLRASQRCLKACQRSLKSCQSTVPLNALRVVIAREDICLWFPIHANYYVLNKIKTKKIALKIVWVSRKNRLNLGSEAEIHYFSDEKWKITQKCKTKVNFWSATPVRT